MPTTPWKAIAALAEDRAISRNQRLPWRIRSEFTWMLQATQGQAVAMGRKTFESMPRALPGRLNIVISRSVRTLPGAVVLPSLDALKNYATELPVWIFGGAQIYAAALENTAVLYLSWIPCRVPDADAHFPDFEDQFHPPKLLGNHPEYQLMRYIHRRYEAADTSPTHP